MESILAGFPLATTRLFAALTAITLSVYFSQKTYFSIYWSILFTHYLLAALGVFKMRSQSSSKANWFAGIGLLALGIPAMYWLLPPILIYFAFHHALNETYTFNRRHKNFRPNWPLNVSRFFFSLFAYTFLLRKRWILANIDERIWLALLVASAISVAICIFRESRHQANKSILDLAIFELSGLVLVISLSGYKLKFEDIVFYHILFWVFYSVRWDLLLSDKKSLRPTLGSVRRPSMVLLTFLLPFVIFPFTPAGGLVGSMDFKFWMYWATALGHLHISASMFFSNMRPSI